MSKQISTTKICRKCRQVQPLSQFRTRPHNRLLYVSFCNACNSLLTRQWRERNRDAIKAYNASYHSRHGDRIYQVAKARYKPRCRRKYQLKKKFGVTEEWYAEQLGKQGGVCGICQAGPVPGAKLFPVDHDHSTGRVRGILCQHCNVVLGRMEKHADWHLAADRYLKLFSDRP